MKKGGFAFCLIFLFAFLADGLMDMCGLLGFAIIGLLVSGTAFLLMENG